MTSLVSIVQFNRKFADSVVHTGTDTLKILKNVLSTAKKLKIEALTFIVPAPLLLGRYEFKILATASWSENAVQFYNLESGLFVVDPQQITANQINELIRYFTLRVIHGEYEVIPPFEFFVTALMASAEDKVYIGNSVLSYLQRWGAQRSILLDNKAPNELWTNKAHEKLLIELFRLHTHTLTPKAQEAANDAIYTVTLPRSKSRGRPRKYLKVQIAYAA